MTNKTNKTELLTNCKLCWDDLNETPHYWTIRKEEREVCEKCNDKITKKFKGKEYKTKQEQTAFLDSLDTIERLGEKGFMKIRIDSREQKSWNFAHYKNIGIVHNGMKTGDYELVGMESFVTVDRKSLGDFVGTMIKGKARFNRELGRMQGYKNRYVFIEATLEDIYDKKYIVRLQNGQTKNAYLNPDSIFGIFLAFEMKHNVKFLFLSNRNTCVRRLVALCDQTIRQEERLLREPNNVSNAVIEKDSYVIHTLKIETFITGLKEKPDKLKELIDTMKGKEHRYLIIRKSWSDLIAEESELKIDVNTLMQSIARIELEYDIRIKFISDGRIVQKYIDKVKEFSEKNIKRREKVVKSFKCELEKKDKAYIV